MDVISILLGFKFPIFTLRSNQFSLITILKTSEIQVLLWKMRKINALISISHSCCVFLLSLSRLYFSIAISPLSLSINWIWNSYVSCYRFLIDNDIKYGLSAFLWLIAFAFFGFSSLCRIWLSRVCDFHQILKIK